MRFGDFFTNLMADLGLRAVDVASACDVSMRQVYRWQKMNKPPRGSALVKLADGLHVPYEVLTAAVTGGRPLPAEYRSREKWKARHELAADRRGTSLAVPESARVMAWFLAAPKAVQHAVLGVVPEGMETEYLEHITHYFRRLLQSQKEAAPKALTRSR